MDLRSDEQFRAQRRALIKATHPDRGGDPDRLMAVLAAFDGPVSGSESRAQPPSRSRSPRPGPRPGPGPSPGRRGTRLTTRLRGAVRDLRTALPRGCPGSIRFVDITDRPIAEETP